MKIGILQAGLVPEELASTWGEYDRIFATHLHRADPEIEIEGWRVVEGGFPPGPGAADGWLISGSKHGVYEDHVWIPPLKDFIRAIVASGRPLIGVCFGHQIMAEALGGRAEKSAKGWGLGPTAYEIVARPEWMRDAPAHFTIPAVHQDQVTTAPPDATRVATSPFCENAALVYGDPETPYAISIQPHPEFTASFARKLIETRRGAAFPTDLSDAALARIDGGDALDGDWVAQWFVDFLRMPRKAS
ncbi:MAG: type 1 glutamine amidotransferase [Paracoccaceae bacterium]